MLKNLGLLDVSIKILNDNNNINYNNNNINNNIINYPLIKKKYNIYNI